MNKFALKLFWRRYNSSIIYRELIRKNKFLNYEFPEQQRSLLQYQDALNLPLTFSFCGEKSKLDLVESIYSAQGFKVTSPCHCQAMFQRSTS